VEEISEIDENAPQPVSPPYQGTKQPSEIDQAIVGETPEEPFKIQPGQTTEARAGSAENKPKYPRRTERDRRETQPNQVDSSDQQNKPKSERPERPGQGGPSGARWKKPEQKTGQPPAGTPTSQSKPEAGSGTTQHRTHRDNRRKRGRRRDSTPPDTQN
jgi:hypothetical protein